jgi:hypothetical protein
MLEGSRVLLVGSADADVVPLLASIAETPGHRSSARVYPAALLLI